MRWMATLLELVIGEVRDDLPGEYDLAYVLTDSSGNLPRPSPAK